jgi:hypothetical protein
MTMHFIRKKIITAALLCTSLKNLTAITAQPKIKCNLCNLLIFIIPNSRDQKVSLLFYKPDFKRRQHMIWSPKVYIPSTMSTENIFWKLQLILAATGTLHNAIFVTWKNSH